MYALTTAIPRQVTPLCMKQLHQVVRGLVTIQHVYKGDTLKFHVFSTKQHYNGLLYSEKNCFMMIQPARSIHQKDVQDQIFFPQYTKDNVPTDYQLIYDSKKGSTHLQMMLLTGPGVLSYLGFIIYWCFKFMDVVDPEDVVTIPYFNWETPMVWTYSLGTLGICLLVSLSVTFKFGTLPVRRVYESADRTKYIGILSKLPWTSQRIEFNLKEVASIQVGAGSIMHKGNATIKGKRCLFYASEFKNPSYYNRLFGHDTKMSTNDNH